MLGLPASHDIGCGAPWQRCRYNHTNAPPLLAQACAAQTPLTQELELRWKCPAPHSEKEGGKEKEQAKDPASQPSPASRWLHVTPGTYSCKARMSTLSQSRHLSFSMSTLDKSRHPKPRMSSLSKGLDFFHKNVNSWQD